MKPAAAHNKPVYRGRTHRPRPIGATGVIALLRTAYRLLNLGQGDLSCINALVVIGYPAFEAIRAILGGGDPGAILEMQE